MLFFNVCCPGGSRYGLPLSTKEGRDLVFIRAEGMLALSKLLESCTNVFS